MDFSKLTSKKLQEQFKKNILSEPNLSDEEKALMQKIANSMTIKIANEDALHKQHGGRKRKASKKKRKSNKKRSKLRKKKIN